MTFSKDIFHKYQCYRGVVQSVFAKNGVLIQGKMLEDCWQVASEARSGSKDETINQHVMSVDYNNPMNYNEKIN